MIRSEDILDQLNCSQCHKYLSVGPVKIYPNREVRCGRCNSDDDHGIPSNLFHIVTKDLTFPCINRFDGCSSAYSIVEMASHETQCHEENYECYFCEQFKGMAYKLNLHCQKYHWPKKLDNREFWINFEKGYQDTTYFYSAGAQLFFIRYVYDADYHELMLEIIFVGMCYKGDIFYSFKFYSTENILLYKTRRLRCSIMAYSMEKMLFINLESIKIPKRYVICKFYVHEEPLLVYKNIIPTIDDCSNNFTLRCTFSNLNEINSDNTQSIHPAVYYFMEIPWRIIVKRRLSLTDYKKKFGVYLQWLNEEFSPVQSCKVSATFSIITADQRNRISKSFVKKDFSPGENCGRMLDDWFHVMDSESGFVKDNRLKIEVNVKLDIPVSNKITCYGCGK